MMAYIGQPTQPYVLVLNTKELYDEVYPILVSVINNKMDVTEIFNQAVDYITDEANLDLPPNLNLNIRMFRNKNIQKDKLTQLNDTFQKLCFELKTVLTDLQVRPIIDMTTSREIYPYYFLNVIRGSVVLKRF